MMKKQAAHGVLLAELCRDYKDYLLGSRLAESTRSQQSKAVVKLVNWLEKQNITALEELNFSILIDYLHELSHLKASSYNIYITYIRKFLRYVEQHHPQAVSGQHIEISNTERLAVPLSSQLTVKYEDRRLPRNLSVQAIEMLMRPSKKENPQSMLTMRNQAILEMLYSTGMRSCEIRNLRIKDLSDDLSECTVQTAKGGNPTIAYLGEPARLAVWKYLSKRAVNFDRDADEYLFLTSNKTPLMGSGLYHLIRDLGRKRLGYPIFPHMLRHSFGTEMLRQSGCLRSTQKMMGHKNIDSTAQYLHLDLSDTTEALRLHHPHSALNSRKADIDFLTEN